jgi:hypothetical protein
MSFIELDGRMVNLDHVREIRSNGKSSVTLVYTDGRRECIEDTCDYGTLKNPTVVAAAPGFHRLRFWFYDEKPTTQAVLEVQRSSRDHHVVAWRIAQYRSEPICIDMEDAPDFGSGLEAILCPDGTVIDCDNIWWNDIRAWAENVVEKWKKWHAGRKAEA